MQDCCLALGIYARRVGLYPASPYDDDNHVACEIFDRRRGKWVMLDPTMGGYVSDGKSPLSVLEMREKFAQNEHISVVFSRQSPRDIGALMGRNGKINAYYAKNLFYLVVVLGEAGCAYLIPENFDFRRREEKYATYMLELARAMGADDAARTYLIFKLQKREDLAEKYLHLFCKKTDTAIQYVQRILPIVAASQSVKKKPEEAEFLSSWVNVSDWQ